MSEHGLDAASADAKKRFEQAGVTPPAERAAGTYANAARMLAVVHWLRQPRSVADEPATVFVPGKGELQ